MKKTISLFITVAIVLCIATVSSFAVSALDYTVYNATEIQKHIVGLLLLSEEKQKEYDFDRDGILSVADATYLQKMIVTDKTTDTTEPTTEPITESTTIVYPTRLEFNKSNLNLGIGEKYTLIKNTDISDFPFAFDSSNETVACVDSNGSITALSCGTATITCSADNGLTASCKVTVGNMAQSVTMNKTSLTLGVGEEFDLNSYIPDNTVAYFRLYTSNNSDVAEVKKSGGIVTAKKQGTATITCKLYNGVTANCVVAVKSAPTSVALSVASKTLKVGENYTINSNTNNGSYSYNSTWTTSNSKVLTVKKTADNKAQISPRMQGTATVTVKTYNGKTASCKIAVSGSKIKCLDVSYAQGNIDFKKVKAAGYNYVIIRAGFGREQYQKDDYFEQNYKNAKAAGLKVGAYWYAYATSKSEAIKEAEACLYCVKGKNFDMPIYYDVEEWSQAYLSKTELTNLIDGFCNKLEDSGFKAGVYATNGMYWNIDKTTLKKKYSTWLAQLNGDFTGITDDVHQYTWAEKVSGITTNVDCNYIYNLNILQ